MKILPSVSLWPIFIVCIKVTVAQNVRSACPVVIAHRGASGYVPEHTLGAYALAVTMGADYVEPDLVITKDGHLIARHENELSLTTDVARRPVFLRRFRTQVVDGRELHGWFSEDFTLAEIKTLRTRESYQAVRPGNARMDLSMRIPTFQEIIDLVKSLEISEGRRIGIIPEIKHSSHFQGLGLPMERPLVEVFYRNGYFKSDDPVYIQSFEISNLKELKNVTDLRLVQLISRLANIQPPDQVLLGTGVTYGDMATPEGLKEIATYAAAVGPDKSLIIPRDDGDRLGETTNFVKNSHAVGLKVYPYTFRAENSFLPLEFKSDNHSIDAIGDAEGEMTVFFATGIDGLFVDQPDIPIRMRGIC